LVSTGLLVLEILCTSAAFLWALSAGAIVVLGVLIEVDITAVLVAGVELAGELRITIASVVVFTAAALVVVFTLGALVVGFASTALVGVFSAGALMVVVNVGASVVSFTSAALGVVFTSTALVVVFDAAGLVVIFTFTALVVVFATGDLVVVVTSTALVVVFATGGLVVVFTAGAVVVVFTILSDLPTPSVLSRKSLMASEVSESAEAEASVVTACANTGCALMRSVGLEVVVFTT
jgi:hypothetical protein